MTTSDYPTEIAEAINLYRAGRQQESRDHLRDFLLQQPAHVDALLWLAKVTPDPQEAIAVAELALSAFTTVGMCSPGDRLPSADVGV